MELRKGFFSLLLVLWCAVSAALPISPTQTGNTDSTQSITHYLHSEWGLLAEADGAGSIQIAYGWSPQRDSSTAPLFARLP